MKRVLPAWIGSALLLLISLSWLGNGNVSAQDTSEVTVTYLQTRVAEQATSIAKRDNKIDQLRTQVANGQQTAIPVTPESAAPSSKFGDLGGTGTALLPLGDGDEIQVVETGTYDGNELPVLLRNNSDKPAFNITVSATVKDNSGALIGAGGDQGFKPTEMLPGEYAIGYLYFDGAVLPGDAVFGFDIESDPSAGLFGSSIDLTYSDGSFLGDRIVGELVNNSDSAATGPFGIFVLCLDGSGGIIGLQQGYTDKDTAAPGETIPFQVTFYPSVDCTNFVIGASGYNF